MSELNIDGNIYIQGITLPNNPGIGTVNCVISGLRGDTPYEFIVVAVNQNGYSGYAGPITVYTLPEIRPAINAFSWSWPFPVVYSGESWIKSTSSKNLISYSQEFNTTSWANQSISFISNDTKAPDGSDTATIIRTSTNLNDYAALRQTQYELKPGTTYTFSYYINTSIGSSAGSFRFRNVTGTENPSFGTPRDIEVAFTQGTIQEIGEGWFRYSCNYYTDEYQDALDSYVISANTPAGGSTFCVWGAQLEEGSTATEYVKTLGFSDDRINVYGATMASYTFDINRHLNYGPNNGITYVWPLVFFGEGDGSATIDNLNGWTLSGNFKRAIDNLSFLPQGKKAFQPIIMNREDWFSFVGDRISVSGATSRNYWGNTFPFPIVNEANYYPSPWIDYGISSGSQFYNEILDIFQAEGITLDYVFGDNETPFFSNFSVIPIQGLTTAYFNDSRYSQTWRGLSSINELMNLYNVNINNISGPEVDKTAYAVWNCILTNYLNVGFNELFLKSSLQKYPNALVSNYNGFLTDGGTAEAPPDLNGHPIWLNSFNPEVVNTVPSPVLYGSINLIDWNISPGFITVNPDDPTKLSQFTGIGATLSRGPWTSFIQAMQTLRSAKRGSPNIPMTPWISSVKDSGLPFQNGPSFAPEIGFADVNVGYDEVSGVTFGSGGNSAYYYELVKHTCLHGVKDIGYFNPSSFARAGVKARDYWAAGLTTYVNDLYLFNETLKEVHEKIGGFTLTTADASRISWLAPYLASGAPGPNGTTWWWRVTTSPGITTSVNGEILSTANNNKVGTWVSTSGPSLDGVTIEIL